MSDFVSKPVDIKQLFATLGKYLRASAGAAPGAGQTAAAASPEIELPQAPGLDLEAGLGRLGGNRALYRKLLVSFARDYAGTCDQVEQELAAGRVEAAEGLMHALKGVAGNIGANEVFQRAQDLDARLKQGRVGQVPQMLQALSSAMAPLLRALDGLEPAPAPAPAVEAKPYDPQAVKRVLARLAQMLDQNDLEAREVLPELKAYFTGPPESDLVQRLEDHLSEYDFEAAIHSLAQLSERV